MKKPSAKRLQKSEALVNHDAAWAAFGTSLAGMDEAGRGPLLGPVVAACVIMPKEPVLPWVDDSKKLSEAQRDAVFAEIFECALSIGVGEASVKEIDELNILNATKLAMQRAAATVPATICLVDAVTRLELPYPVHSIIHGDAASYSIAAASIVAKVTRDRLMAELAGIYPHYGLERNKGYGTAEHLEALRQYGPCPEHRRLFIRNYVGETRS